MVSQPRHWSFIEAVANTVIGYSVALVGQLIVFPLMGIAVRLDQNIIIGAIFTVISVIRGYWVRRLFNWFHTVMGWGNAKAN